jgi:hypothetical protein
MAQMIEGEAHRALRPSADAADSHDRRLAPFLRAVQPASEEEALATLMVVHVQPLVGKILHGKLGRSPAGGEIEDLGSKVVVLLLARLHQLKHDAAPAIIRDLDDYVATTTYRVYHDHLREKYPHRHRLKTRLRYLLTHDARFALWQGDEGSWMCGWARWRDARGRTPASVVQRLASIDFRVPGWERSDLIDALTSVFEGAGHPVAFDAVVGLLAERSPLVSTAADDDGAHDAAAQRMAGDPARQADDRIFLQQLWTEIRKLPLNMRTVLLLNLRGPEGRDVIGLLPATGVASVREMATTLEMPVEHLAALWQDLPLDDRALAARLNATRQQIINLRASARRRLARRMGRDA